MTPFPPSLAIAVAVSIGAHAAAALYLAPRMDIMQAAAAPSPLASLPDGFGRPPALPQATEAAATRYLASPPPSPDALAAPRSRPSTPTASAAVPVHTGGIGRPAQPRTQASAPAASGARPSPLSHPAAVRATALETPLAVPVEPRRTAAPGSPRGNGKDGDAMAMETPLAVSSAPGKTAAAGMPRDDTLTLDTPQASPLASRKTEAAGSQRGAAMASYLQGVHGALQEALRYPVAARSRHWQGQATLDITLSREGRLLAHRLHASSGHASLDDASLQAAQRARFAPAPPDLEGESFRFRVPLRFHLDGGAGY